MNKHFKYIYFLLLVIFTALVFIVCKGDIYQILEQEKDASSPPADITNLNISVANEGSKVTLTWTDPTDRDLDYIEIIATPALIGQPFKIAKGILTKDFTSLTNGLLYSFTVRSVDTSGNKATGISVSGTPKDNISPSDVSNLTRTVYGGSGMVTLSWTEPSDSDLVKTQISVSPLITGSPFDIDKGITTKNITGLSNGVTYDFTLKTFDSSGNKSNGVTTVANLSDTVAPSEVSGLSATSGNNQITLNWTNPTDIDFKEIKITASPSLPTSTMYVAKTASPNDSITITGLLGDTQYTFTVKTRDNYNNESSGSVISKWTNDNVPPDEVSNFRGITGYTDIYLTWTEPPNIDYNNLEITAVPSISGQPFIINKGTTQKFITVPSTDSSYAITIKTVDNKNNKSSGSSINVKTNYYKQMIQINSAMDSYTMGDSNFGCNCTQTLTYNFKMCKYELTNGWYAEAIADGLYSNSSYWTNNGWEWRTINSRYQPTYWTDANFNSTDQPVVGVSWYESVAFCNWLSTKCGLMSVYQSSGAISSLTISGYRLPTEVEWEYAASKGSNGQSERIYPWGDIWDCTKLACNVSTCSISKTTSVGVFSSGNALKGGFCDMSGNTREWCSDEYTSSVSSGTNWYYFSAEVQSSTNLVNRGGIYVYILEFYFRNSNRNFDVATYSGGFRVVLP